MDPELVKILDRLTEIAAQQVQAREQPQEREDIVPYLKEVISLLKEPPQQRERRERVNPIGDILGSVTQFRSTKRRGPVPVRLVGVASSFFTDWMRNVNRGFILPTELQETYKRSQARSPQQQGPGQSLGNNILMIAAAMGVLALTLVGFSAFNVGEIVLALGALFGILYGLKTFGPDLKKFSIGFGILSTSLLLLYGALMLFQNMSWTGLTSMVGTLIAIGSVMLLFARLGDQYMDSIAIFAQSMLIVSGALLALGAALVVFRFVDWQAITKGLVVFGAVMAGISLLIVVAEKFQRGAALITKMGRTLKWLAITLGIITLSFIAFAFIPWEAIVKGFTAIGTGILLLATAGKVAGIQTAIVLGALTASILGMTGAFILMSRIDIGKVAAVLSIVTTFTVVFALLSNVLAPALPLMAVVAGILLAIAGASFIFAKSLEVMAGAMEKFVVVVDGFGRFIAKVFQGVLDTLFQFSQIPFFKIAKGMLQLALVGPLLIPLGIALSFFSIGLSATGLALYAVSGAFIALHQSAKAFAELFYRMAQVFDSSAAALMSLSAAIQTLADIGGMKLSGVAAGMAAIGAIITPFSISGGILSLTVRGIESLADAIYKLQSVPVDNLDKITKHVGPLGRALSSFAGSLLAISGKNVLRRIFDFIGGDSFHKLLSTITYTINKLKGISTAAIKGISEDLELVSLSILKFYTNLSDVKNFKGLDKMLARSLDNLNNIKIDFAFVHTIKNIDLLIDALLRLEKTTARLDIQQEFNVKVDPNIRGLDRIQLKLDTTNIEPIQNLQLRVDTSELSDNIREIIGFSNQILGEQLLVQKDMLQTLVNISQQEQASPSIIPLALAGTTQRSTNSTPGNIQSFRDSVVSRPYLQG